MDSSGRFLFANFNSSFKCPNCSDFCFYADPSCVFLPPIPLPYFDYDNATTQTNIGIQRPTHLLPAFLIGAGALLAVSFFVFLTFYAVLKRGRRLRRQSLALPLPPQEQGNGAGDGQGDGSSTHHVWLIRTVGLDESIIGSITTTAYRSRPGGGECTVCLGEFEDGEMVKLLPRCTHTFHASCIDTWLRSHVNCPLCRAPVLVVAATDPAVGVEVDGSNSHPDVPAASISSEDESEASASSSSSSELPKEMEEDGFQPVRRSVSMDSSLLLHIADEPNKQHGEIPRMDLELSVVSDHEAKQAGTASLKGKEEGPLAMKRSQSTRSGRFFLPRYGRFRNPILPL